MAGDVRVLRAAGRTAAPWSNGGGVTREIAAHPEGAGWSAFTWRVSLADVTRDGPYSPLPGIRRVLTVVDGAGLHLTVDGTAHPPLARHTPFAFPGAATTGSRLVSGPVVNLNVMVREGRARADVTLVRGTHDLPCTAGVRLVVALPDGRGEWPDEPGAAAVPPGGEAAAPSGAVLMSEGVAVAELGVYDAASLPAGTAAELRTEGIAAVITLTEVAQGT
ncbi:HutD family protein [Streptomyces sp. BBFR2]|uniref:HutD/Ves family protein n=1 Tax=Streptomyces sp. BBFR2 TaxID=3372854 RepID=UPI0037DA34BA